ncbi:MAG TPA: transcriptional repressor [Alphaproteobacteria bacterium]|nr:transcriptional repressor [Alphaproteobacteria bacterium]HAM46626.1 transcriptional repressor [Alphaproteobacteria bacterium]HBA41988.1 transcriptional repressor [Alphaproteobacteria bacterium]HBC55437.1 transcriptional repressor [Alphaproteobacteria bacterium]
MTMTKRPFADALEKLRAVGLRPTRQRLALARLLFENGDRHLTAETLYEEAQAAEIRVSLATIYNSLHQFTEAGLLREVAVGASRTYFDTNVSDHHHFYYEDCGRLVDIAGGDVTVDCLTQAPDGTEIARVEVIIRVAGTPAA